MNDEAVAADRFAALADPTRRHLPEQLATPARGVPAPARAARRGPGHRAEGRPAPVLPAAPGRAHRAARLDRSAGALLAGPAGGPGQLPAAHRAAQPGGSRVRADIDLSASYPFPPERVWAALTSSEALATWLMPNDFAP